MPLYEPLIVKKEGFGGDLSLLPDLGLPDLPDTGVGTPKVPDTDVRLPTPPVGTGVPTTPTTPAGSLPGRLLKLHTLKCDETEDYSPDEAMLDVFVDDVPVSLPVGRERAMDEGSTWALNSMVPFLNKVRIELREEDSPDADDFLGAVDIGAGPVRGAHGKFTLDDADYTIFYDVLEPKELAGDELAALKRFLGVP